MTTPTVEAMLNALNSEDPDLIYNTLVDAALVLGIRYDSHAFVWIGPQGITGEECGDLDDTQGPCRLRPNHLGAHYWEPTTAASIGRVGQ